MTQNLFVILLGSLVDFMKCCNLFIKGKCNPHDAPPPPRDAIIGGGGADIEILGPDIDILRPGIDILGQMSIFRADTWG